MILSRAVLQYTSTVPWSICICFYYGANILVYKRKRKVNSKIVSYQENGKSVQVKISFIHTVHTPSRIGNPKFLWRFADNNHEKTST